jgi:hypothetical protein
MRQQEVRVKLTLSEGYEERFTKACIQVARKRVENQEKESHPDPAMPARKVAVM